MAGRADSVRDEDVFAMRLLRDVERALYLPKKVGDAAPASKH